MLKRYLLTGLGFILLFFIYYLTLLPLLAIRANLEPSQFIIALVIWGILACIFMLPAAAMIIKKVWFFRGKGEPVVLKLLQSLLLDINKQDSPVLAKKQRKKNIITWRLDEQNWCERFEKAGMKRIYELWLDFDNSTKTVTMTDKYRSANWDLSPISVKTGWLVYSKPYFNIKTGRAWGVENYVDTLPDDYEYSPDEIKSPVMNTILKNGWNVRFSLF